MVSLKNFENQKNKMNLEWNQFTSFIGGDFFSLITDNYNMKISSTKARRKTN